MLAFGGTRVDDGLDLDAREFRGGLADQVARMAEALDIDTEEEATT